MLSKSTFYGISFSEVSEVFFRFTPTSNLYPLLYLRLLPIEFVRLKNRARITGTQLTSFLAEFSNAGRDDDLTLAGKS